MKKTTFALVAFYVIITAIAFSCQKPYNRIAPVNVSITQLATALRSTPQSINVPAGQDVTVHAAAGTKMHFYANSFKDAAGNVITSGTVNLQVIEMYKPGDMIANNASTIANGQLLQSGGQVNVSATMNGQPVYANKYALAFRQQGTSTQPMSLFYGSPGASNPVITWTQADTSQNGTTAHTTNPDSAWMSYAFDSCTNLSWINCDRFYMNDSPKTSVSVVLPDSSFNASNSVLYLVLPDINSVMSTTEPWLGGSSYDATTHTLKLISEGQTNIVPAGMNYKLLVMTAKDGNFYYYQTSGVITRSMVKTADMQVLSVDEIKSKLSEL